GHLCLEAPMPEVVLGHEFGERLGFLLLLPASVAPADEQPAQEVEYTYSDGHHHGPDRSEREETERFHTRIDEGLLYDEVGRSAYQREEPHAAGERHRHQVTARTDTRRGGHAHYDGHHHRHRSRIAHESAYECRHEHHENEKDVLVLPSDTQDAAAYHFGEPRSEDAGTHDEQADHHDHHRTGKTGKRLVGRKDTEDEQGEQGAERDDIRPDLTAHEKETRYDKYGQGHYRGG